MSRFFLIVFFLSSFLYANGKNCSVHKEIIYTILLNEGLPKKAGYEYIISFNNSSDAKKLQKTALKPYFINNRTIDCKNKELCTYILYGLSKEKITNVDLGAFQINYRVHNLDTLSDYFDINKSYVFACNYIETMVKKYGNNYKAYASYHSQTPKFNEKYKNTLIKNHKKVQKALAKIE